MKKLYALLFICLFSGVLKAQTYTISGTVADSINKMPLPGVYVFTKDKQHTTSTDANGNFSLALPKGKHTLVFHFIGFKPKEVSLLVNEETAVQPLQIYLIEDKINLQTYVVSGSRFEEKLEETTVSIEVIKPKLLENRNTYSVDNVVKQIPGVDVQDGQANIRGGSGFSYGAGSRVMVLLDDLPLISADAGDVKWNYLPVENVEQLEVTKGASSVLYGSSSLNGVINLITKNPTSTPETKINVFHGFYWDPVRPDSLGNKRDSTGKLRKPLKWWKEQNNPTITGMDFYHGKLVKNFAYTVSGNLFSNDGYRQGEFEKRLRGFTKLKYFLNDKKNHYVGVNAAAMYQNAAYFLLWLNADSGAFIPRGGLDTPATSLTYTHGIRANIDPYWRYIPSDKTEHNVKTRFYRTVNNNLAGNQSSNGNVWFAEYRLIKKYNTWKISSGLAYSYSQVKSNLYDDHNAENRAIYLQANKDWNRLKLVMGIRGEYYRIDSTETQTDVLLPKGIKITKDNTTWNDTIVLAKNLKVKPVIRLGLNYRIHKATFVRFSYGQGYRFPSIAERYVRTSLSGLNVFPNPDLKPETGWSTEIGVKQGFKFHNLKGFVDITGFWMEYQNMIEFQFGTYYPPELTSPNITDLFNYSGFKSVNVGSARISGYEAGFNVMYTYKDLDIIAFGGYTYMNPINMNYDSAYRATFSDTTTNMLKYRFKHMFRSDLQINYKKIGFGFSSRYNSFMVNIDRAFEEPLFGNIEQTKLLPGLKEYRQQHNSGNWVFDARIIFKATKSITLSVITNNVFNTEYMGRPADIRPPRTTMIRYSMTF